VSLLILLSLLGMPNFVVEIPRPNFVPPEAIKALINPKSAFAQIPVFL
jgi:hypothetical protein